MKHIAVYLVLLLSIALTSCTEEAVNVKLPDATPKLVVGAFISPQDEEITVSVTKTVPLLGQVSQTGDDNIVRNATVTISNGSASRQLPFNVDTRSYIVAANVFPIEAGKTYSLLVTTPEGGRAEASCTVPLNKATGIEVKAESTEQGNFGANLLSVNYVSWESVPGKPAYFRPHGVVKTYSRNNQAGTVDTVKYSLYFRKKFVEDKGTSGSNKIELNSSQGATFTYYSSAGSPVKLHSAEISILTIDQHYYRYYISLEKYLPDDFFAEPSMIYTNVKGGVGVFAAYQRSTKTVYF